MQDVCPGAHLSPPLPFRSGVRCVHWGSLRCTFAFNSTPLKIYELWEIIFLSPPPLHSLVDSGVHSPHGGSLRWVQTWFDTSYNNCTNAAHSSVGSPCWRPSIFGLGVGAHCTMVNTLQQELCCPKSWCIGISRHNLELDISTRLCLTKDSCKFMSTSVLCINHGNLVHLQLCVMYYYLRLGEDFHVGKKVSWI